MPRRSYISSSNSNTGIASEGFAGVSGTAQGGTTSEIILASGASSEDGFYVGASLYIESGTEAGYRGQIIKYEGATRTASVVPDLPGAPSTDSDYVIYGFPGLVQGGSRNSVTLHSSANSADGAYLGALVVLLKNGLLEVREITAYDGTSKVATVFPGWSRPPVAGDNYLVVGEGGTAAGIGATSITFQAGAHGSVDDFYNGMVVEITGSSGELSAIGQVREITDYAGSTRQATVAAWSPEPSGTVTYRVFPGFSGSFERVEDFARMNCQVVGAPGDHGALLVTESMTATGVNANGLGVKSTVFALWGTKAGGKLVGESSHSFAVQSQYLRATVIPFGPGLTGGVQTRFSRDSPPVTRNLSQDVTPGGEGDTVRAVLAAQQEGNGALENLTLTSGGRLSVDTPRSSFGDAQTGEITPQIQMNFSNEVGEQDVRIVAVGDQSTCRHEVTKYQVRLGDSPITPTVADGDRAYIETKRIGRYRAGLGSLARFALNFAETHANLVQRCGLSDGGNALEFGYSTDGGTSQFGINRARGGRLEVRTFQVAGAATNSDDLTFTFPALAGGTDTFTVTVSNGDPAETVARKIANDASPSWASRGWNIQNVRSRLVLSSTAYVARAGTYTFSAGSTGVTLSTVQQVQLGDAGSSTEEAQKEFREVQVISGAGTTDTLTIQLNSSSNTVSLNSSVHDTAKKVAWAIVNSAATDWEDLGATGQGWRAEIVGEEGTTVRFTALTVGLRNGTYSYSYAGTGAEAQTVTIRKQAGQPPTDNWVYQRDWNIDQCDGAGPSGFLLNPQKGNVYAIEFQYLGFGNIFYSVEDPRTGRFIRVHEERYSGSSILTHLENPHLPLRASLEATGSMSETSALGISSWAYFTIGPLVSFEPKFSVNNLFESPVSTGTKRCLILFKHPEVYNSSLSQVHVKIRNVSVGIESAASSISVYEVRLNPTLGSSYNPIWNLVRYPDSPILVAKKVEDDGSTPDLSDLTVTGGDLLASKGTAGDSVFDLSLSDYPVNRGDVLAVVATITGGNAEVIVSVDWVEDH